MWQTVKRITNEILGVKGFTPQHQHVYSLPFPLYISSDTDTENSFKTQKLIFLKRSFPIFSFLTFMFDSAGIKQISLACPNLSDNLL